MVVSQEILSNSLSFYTKKKFEEKIYLFQIEKSCFFSWTGFESNMFVCVMVCYDDGFDGYHEFGLADPVSLC